MQDQTSGIDPNTDAAHRPDACSKCGHDNSGQDVPNPSAERGLRRLFGLRARPARCDHVDDELDPWGPMRCPCRAAFHGS